MLFAIFDLQNNDGRYNHMTLLEQTTVDYNDSDIKTLEWDEHIRRRPGMYIGKLGDGSHSDDGIYVLLKEVLDNSIDEYVMGAGKKVEITIRDGQVTVRDYGRGIPLGKLIDATSKMNTGGKIDSKAFKKSVGLNGVVVLQVKDSKKPAGNRLRAYIIPSNIALCQHTLHDLPHKPAHSGELRYV